MFKSILAKSKSIFLSRKITNFFKWTKERNTFNKFWIYETIILFLHIIFIPILFIISLFPIFIGGQRSMIIWNFLMNDFIMTKTFNLPFGLIILILFASSIVFLIPLFINRSHKNIWLFIIQCRNSQKKKKLQIAEDLNEISYILKSFLIQFILIIWLFFVNLLALVIYNANNIEINDINNLLFLLIYFIYIQYQIEERYINKTIYIKENGILIAKHPNRFLLVYYDIIDGPNKYFNIFEIY